MQMKHQMFKFKLGWQLFFLSPLEGSGHPQTGSDAVSFLNILKAEFIILVTFSIWLLFLLEIVLCLASCSLVLPSHV